MDPLPPHRLWRSRLPHRQARVWHGRNNASRGGRRRNTPTKAPSARPAPPPPPHVQIDDNAIERRPDPAGSDFFLYDLYWGHFASGDAIVAELKRLTGIEVKTLADFRQAQQAIFAAAGPLCIAVKTSHAYRRTLAWQPRTDTEAEAALLKKLAGGQPTPEEANCLGDWSLARGVELAIQYNLPVKIHTGYLAGWDNMLAEHVRPGLLCPLLLAYPKARFILMHAAYPYSGELAAIAKNFTNVWIDLCWAWAMDPCSTADFARRLIHSVPTHKVFAFGGDTMWPMMTVGYAHQTRRWLTRALQAEIDDGLLSERGAVDIASAWMRENQYEVFDVAGRRARLTSASKL